MRPALLALTILVSIPAAAETVDGRNVVIIHGDTIAIGRERLRLLNIDAPESLRPRCERELVAGLRAKQRLAGLLRSGTVEIDPHGRDSYRRILARVYASGRDIGDILVREGLALPWRDGPAAHDARMHHWCG